MPLSYNLPEDKLIWTGNRRGDFTIKSAYYIALSLVEAEETNESSFGDPRTPLMEENVASKDSSKNKNLRLAGLHEWPPN